MWQDLKLLIWKNWIIRRRHWLLTIVEILIPVVMFTLVAYCRSKISSLSKVEIPTPTYFDVLPESQIYRDVPVGQLRLWYAPDAPLADTLIDAVQNRFQIPGEDVQKFTSEEALLKHYAKSSNSRREDTKIVAVVFDLSDSKRLKYDLKIHDKQLVWSTDKLLQNSLFENEIEAAGQNYIYHCFAAFQLAIDWAFIAHNAPTRNTTVFNLQQFPYPPHTKDMGLNDLFLTFLPLVTLFSFIFLCPAVLKRVIEEKSSGIKELMKMVGMKSWSLWLSWFIHGLATNFISIVIIVVLMKAPLWGVKYPPIEYTDGSLLFVFLILYAMAAISFCFFISSFFSKPSLGMVFGILVWIFSYFVPKAILENSQEMSQCYKLLLGIFPNMALQYGYTAISVYETREIGAQWGNLHKTPTGGDDITMLHVLLLFIGELFVFMLLTVYMDNVNPGSYGIPKPFLYPLEFIFRHIAPKVEETGEEVAPLQKQKCHIEDASAGEQACIKIRKLYKRYNGHAAVENLSMDIYKNQITVLLGENGAGKTTTMSVITGMIDATSGSVKIHEKDIRKHIGQVRSKMGLCPQHNLLFPDLTVKEHLKFFAMLKGMSSRKADQQADDLAAKLSLSHRRDYLASGLSGGMKRKLCLGMALIGDSDILVLDEPTSGMDPESRRKMWDFLLEIRKTKTILITTHFMDEADALADWISIMYRGKLQCYGTPMYLKNTYKTGYHLSLMLNDIGLLEKDTIVERLRNELTDVEEFSHNGNNIVIQLPMEQKQKFYQAFKELEEDKENLGIEKMSLSITTLNDVFLKAKDEMDHDDNNVNPTMNEKTNNTLSGKIKSQMLKRWYFLKRKLFFYIPGLLVGLLIFLTTMILGQGTTDYLGYGGPGFDISLTKYGKTDVYYSGPQESLAPFLNAYESTVLEQGSSPQFVADVAKNIIARGVENIAFYKKHMVAGAVFSADKTGIEITCLFSGTALHSIPISINLATNAVAKGLLGKEFSISTRNAPLKTFYTDFSPSEISEAKVGILWLIFVPIGGLFLMSSFLVFPNFEVSTNFIQLQLMTGINAWLYWILNFVFDFCIFLVKLVIIFVVLVVVNILCYDSFGSQEVGALIVLALVYGVATLPYTYLFSYKKTVSGGFALYIILGMFMGLVPTVGVQVMENSQDSYYMHIAKVMKHILLCICPQFGLSYFSVNFARMYVANYNWDNMEADKQRHLCESQENPCCRSLDSVECQNHRSYFSNDTLGFDHNNLAEMMMNFVVYMLVLWSVETRFFKKFVSVSSNILSVMTPNCRKQPQENDDHDSVDFSTYMSMTLRRKKTQLHSNLKDGLHAINVKKCLGGKQIVKDVTMNVDKSKCYGLLGVNGAGKTTTFKMLTASLLHDGGSIYMRDGDRKKLESSSSEYCGQIGYCPQENYLNFALTGREILTILGYMKGHKEPAKLAGDLIDIFGLEKHADKPCAEYSGGNKRKLNTAMAFVGNPKIILLDEPTSGVDPSGRRKFWNTLSHVKNRGATSFVLCSHSMEECEALSDVIGIMKKGEIQCEGSLLSLKNEHQKGFTINLKLNMAKLRNYYSTDDVDSTSIAITDDPEPDSSETAPLISDKVQEDITKVFGDVELKDKHLGFVSYHIKDPNKRLSQMFKDAENMKNHYPFIEDYTISEASLEDVFLNIAKS